MKRLLLPSLMLAAGLASAGAVDSKAGPSPAEQAAARQESHDVEQLQRVRGCYAALLGAQERFSAPAAGGGVYHLINQPDSRFRPLLCRPGEDLDRNGCALVGHTSIESKSGEAVDASAHNAQERRDALAAFRADIETRLASLGADVPEACRGPQPPKRRGTPRVSKTRCGGGPSVAGCGE